MCVLIQHYIPVIRFRGFSECAIGLILSLFWRLYCVPPTSVPTEKVFLSEWPHAETEEGEDDQ